MYRLLLSVVVIGSVTAASAQDQFSDVSRQPGTKVHPESSSILGKDGSREQQKEANYWARFRQVLRENLLKQEKALSAAAIDDAIRRALEAIEPPKSNYSEAEAPDNSEPSLIPPKRHIPHVSGGSPLPTGNPAPHKPGEWGIEPSPTKNNSSVFLFFLLGVFLVPAAAITFLVFGVSRWRVGRRTQGGVFLLIGCATLLLIYSAVTQVSGDLTAAPSQEKGFVPAWLSRMLQPLSMAD